MAKKLIISIDKNGFVNAEVSGVRGGKCLDYISLLEDILEGNVVSREYTHEYHQQETEVKMEQNLQAKLK